MFNYFSRIPCIYSDVKESLQSLLDQGNMFLLGEYDKLETTFGVVKALAFNDEGKDLDSYDLVEFSLLYSVKKYKENVGFYDEECSGNFIYLHANGDNKWTTRLVYKLWENNFPSGLLLEKDSKKLYIVRFDLDKLKLEYFCTLNDEELELVLSEINNVTPYEISIDNDVLLRYVDGGVGLDYLYSNIYIQLNCSVPLYLRKG